MSLVFTPVQIKSISQDVLKLPDKRDNPESGLIKKKADYAALAVKLNEIDSGQKVFSDSWIATVSAYHGELKELANSQRTNYSETHLIDGANGVRSNTGHFPTTPPWAQIQPMLIPSNNGLPITALTPNGELEKISLISPLISLLTSGFSATPVINDSGALTGTNLKVTNSGSFTVGQKLLILTGTESMIVSITALNTVPVHSVDFSITVGSVADGTVNFQNYFPGFTNSQRQGQSSLGIYSNIYGSLRNSILSKVSVWETSIDYQISQLSTNNDLLNQANITAAKNNVNSVKTAIDTWQALPDLSVNGLLSDAGLLILNNKITDRQAQIPARITIITTDLGSVSQNAQGTPSGSGAYFELFKLVGMRNSIGMGTLTAYVDNVRNQGFFDLRIKQVTDQIAQYSTVMVVSKILANTVPGQDTFTVNSVAGLSANDNVLVMDDDSIQYSRSILQITGTQVKLNSGIPISLLAEKLSRIVKML